MIVGTSENADSDLAILATHFWYYDFINQLTFYVALIIFISCLDDLFIDACYWIRRFYRFVFFRNIYRPPTVEQLATKHEQSAAIMVPAWHEYDVIADMLESNMKLIQYKNYVFFVGVYQNDPATSTDVDKVVAKYPNVKKVVVPHDGPTCKADCLNWIVQAIILHEQHTGMEFEMIVMHDSEDIIHPYELRMFNYLTPRKDLIQFPVRCLETKWSDLVRGSYIDEFAEFHSKDMVVREALAKVVPSAGVSTCFSRKAIQVLCEENASQPFNTDSLTEDYDVSYRLNTHKEIKQIFAVFPVSVESSINTSLFKRSLIPIATLELFPNKWYAAIRQRTRWNIGIFFQAMNFRTWRGGFFAKYFFFRDRKGIITNIAMLPAYFLLMNIVAMWFGNKLLNWPAYVFDVPVWLVCTNTFFLLNRAFQRMYFTGHLYGPVQSLLSIPRIFVSNIINFSSTVRACFIFGSYLITGKTIAWDKTTHEYPSFQTLEKQYKKLGVCLIENQVISEKQLEELLEEQKVCHMSLGFLLKAKGLISENDLMNIVSAQIGYTRGTSNNADPQKAIELLSAEIILHEEIFPLAVSEDKILDILVTRSLNARRVLGTIRSFGYAAVNSFVISEDEMNRLLKQVHRAYTGQKHLGELLVHKKLITEEQLQSTLSEQRLSHTPLGSLLEARGLVNNNDLLNILSEQTGYAIGNPKEVLPPKEAVKVLHPAIILHHSLYPVSVDEETNILTVLTTKEVSERAKLAVVDFGYSGLEPLIVLDENMAEYWNTLQSYLETYIFYDPNEKKDSPVPARKIGHYLLEHRHISYAQLNELLEKQKHTHQRLGDLLINNGIMKKNELENIFTEIDRTT